MGVMAESHTLKPSQHPCTPMLEISRSKGSCPDLAKLICAMAEPAQSRPWNRDNQGSCLQQLAAWGRGNECEHAQHGHVIEKGREICVSPQI